jgi:two-component system sensor histidine kinase PhoQ
VRLTVEVDPDVTARDRLVVTVDDDGPGISTEDQSRVGQRGVRADESVPGHGIGLAMVRDTVDLYGGRFTIDASDLGGASISLTLPGR